MAQTNGFTVTTEQLDKAANEIKNKTAQYDADVKRLYTEVENLASAQWKGIASDAFRAKVEGYRPDFEELKTALEQFAESLLTKSKNYSNTENALTSAAQSL